MVTQLTIARRLGMDVSSVNKILNDVKGPKFNQRTIVRVLKTAHRLGYRIKPNSKGQLASRMAEIRRVLEDRSTSPGYQLARVRDLARAQS